MKKATFFSFINHSKRTELASRGWIAASAFQRMRGLLGFDNLQPGQGLFLKPGNCIHMRGMKFPLDIIFVDRTLTVVKVVENVVPEPRWKLWKMTFGGWNAHSCFELPIGTISKSRTEPGDKIELRKAPEKSQGNPEMAPAGSREDFPG